MPFQNPIVAGQELRVAAIESDNYIRGIQGWAITRDGDAKFDSISATDTIGAGTVSAQAVTLTHQDLATEILDPLPLGVVDYSSLVSGDRIGDVGATETVAVIAKLGSVVVNRLYKICVQGHFQAFGTIAAIEAYDIRLRYTTDGTTPTTASPTLPGGTCRINLSPDHGSDDFHHIAFYPPAASYDLITVALTIQRAGGTGTGGIYQGAADRRLFIWMEDTGFYSSAQNAGTIQQVIKASLAGPDPVPTQTYTKTYPAIWSRSYDQDNGTRNADDTPDMHVGWTSNVHGNTKSLAGFDYASIRALLAGGSNIVVTGYFTPKYRTSADGFDVWVSTHDYTANPSIYDTARVDELQANIQNSVPNATYAVNLSAHAAEFKAGTANGIGFGPGLGTESHYTGYIYGYDASNVNGHDYRPTLKFTVTK
jgi:hypothetical protein